MKDIKSPLENKGNKTEHYAIMSTGSLLEHLDIDNVWWREAVSDEQVRIAEDCQGLVNSKFKTL